MTHAFSQHDFQHSFAAAFFVSSNNTCMFLRRVLFLFCPFVIQWIPHSVLDQTFQLLEMFVTLAMPNSPIAAHNTTLRIAMAYTGEVDEDASRAGQVFHHPDSGLASASLAAIVPSAINACWMPPNVVVQGICAAMLDRFTVHSQSYRSARQALVQLLVTPRQDLEMSAISDQVCPYFAPLLQFCFESVGYPRVSDGAQSRFPRIVSPAWSNFEADSASSQLRAQTDCVIGTRAPAPPKDEALEERMTLLLECVQYLNGEKPTPAHEWWITEAPAVFDRLSNRILLHPHQHLRSLALHVAHELDVMLHAAWNFPTTQPQPRDRPDAYPSFLRSRFAMILCGLNAADDKVPVDVVFLSLKDGMLFFSMVLRHLHVRITSPTSSSCVLPLVLWVGSQLQLWQEVLSRISTCACTSWQALTVLLLRAHVTLAAHAASLSSIAHAIGVHRGLMLHIPDVSAPRPDNTCSNNLVVVSCSCASASDSKCCWLDVCTSLQHLRTQILSRANSMLVLEHSQWRLNGLRMIWLMLTCNYIHPRPDGVAVVPQYEDKIDDGGWGPPIESAWGDWLSRHVSLSKEGPWFASKLAIWSTSLRASLVAMSSAEWHPLSRALLAGFKAVPALIVSYPLFVDHLPALPSTLPVVSKIGELDPRTQNWPTWLKKALELGPAPLDVNDVGSRAEDLPALNTHHNFATNSFVIAESGNFDAAEDEFCDAEVPSPKLSAELGISAESASFWWSTPVAYNDSPSSSMSTSPTSASSSASASSSSAISSSLTDSSGRSQLLSGSIKVTGSHPVKQTVKPSTLVHEFGGRVGLTSFPASTVLRASSGTSGNSPHKSITDRATLSTNFTNADPSATSLFNDGEEDLSDANLGIIEIDESEEDAFDEQRTRAIHRYEAHFALTLVLLLLLLLLLLLHEWCQLLLIYLFCCCAISRFSTHLFFTLIHMRAQIKNGESRSTFGCGGSQRCLHSCQPGWSRSIGRTRSTLTQNCYGRHASRVGTCGRRRRCGACITGSWVGV